MDDQLNITTTHDDNTQEVDDEIIDDSGKRDSFLKGVGPHHPLFVNSDDILPKDSSVNHCDDNNGNNSATRMDKAEEKEEIQNSKQQPHRTSATKKEKKRKTFQPPSSSRTRNAPNSDSLGTSLRGRVGGSRIIDTTPEEEPQQQQQQQQQSSPKTTKHPIHNSFFADSPYYDAFVKEELKSLQLVSETLQDISDQTKDFVIAGTVMSQATKKLALSCQLRNSCHTTTNATTNEQSSTPAAENNNNTKEPQNQKQQQQQQQGEDNSNNDDETKNAEYHKQIEEDHKRRQEALGKHLTTVFERVGEMLIKIASLQENLCSIIESTLGPRMEEIVLNQVDIFNSLQDDVAKQGEKAETLFFNYLINNNINNTTTHRILDQISNRGSKSNNTMNNHFLHLVDENDVSSYQSESEPAAAIDFTAGDALFGGRRDSQSNSNHDDKRNTIYTDDSSTNNDDLFGHMDMTTSSTASTNFDDDGSEGLSVSTTTTTNNILVQELKRNMEVIRTEQGIAEFKRILLYKHIVDAKYQRTYIVSQGVESFCQELTNYFSTSNEILKDVTKHVQKNKKKTKKLFQGNQQYMKNILLENQRKEEDKPSFESNDIFSNTYIDADHDFSISTTNDLDFSTSTFDENIKASPLIPLRRAMMTNNCNSNDNELGISLSSSTRQIFSGGRNMMMAMMSSSTSASSILFGKSRSHARANSSPTYSGSKNRVSEIKKKLLLENIEAETGVWDIPTSVATTLPYNRESPPGVLMEGWLYERRQQQEDREQQDKKEQGQENKATKWGFFNNNGKARLSTISDSKSLSTSFTTAGSSTHDDTWKKRWCLLKYDGIYSLDLREEGGDSSSTVHEEIDGLSIKKICDIDSCTIQKMACDNNNTERFCFRISILFSSSEEQQKQKEQQLQLLSGEEQLLSTSTRENLSKRRFNFLNPITSSHSDESDCDKNNEYDEDNINVNDNIKRNIIFQARGPKDLNRWINGIHSASLGAFLTVE